MKKVLTSLTVLVIIVTAVGIGSAHAAVLSVDFGPGTAQTGFQAQSSASATYTTSLGDITATSDGSFFNRGGTAFDLHDDFTYENNGTTGFNFTLSGAGISVNTDYNLKLWAYDSNTPDQTTSFNGQNGSTGSLDIFFDASVKPTTLDDYSGTATFTSNSSGVIDVAITASAGAEGPRFNGFEISVVPEPTSLALLGLGGLLLMSNRRRRR